MESVRIDINRDEAFPINLFVVLLFLLLNPLYVIAICAVLNFLNARINFRLFSSMFALSFALVYFLRDWGMSGDPYFYLHKFQIADNRSLLELFQRFIIHPHSNEVFYYLYLWISNLIFGGNVRLFAYINYFIIFLLTAYLAKVVDERRYVVILLCILFVNPGFMINLFQLWRHIFALLIFFTGIYLFESSKNRRISRIIMYSACLFHLVVTPYIILYEMFNLFTQKNNQLPNMKKVKKFKWYSIQTVAYATLVAVTFIMASKYAVSIAPYLRLSSVFLSYWKDISSIQSGYNYLFNPLSCIVIFYFWFNRKKISTNDLFIGLNYFATIFTMIALNIPTMVVGRMLSVFLVGASILSARLMLSDFITGLFILFVMILYRFYIIKFHTLSGPEMVRGLTMLVGGELLNPACGILWMIYNYDSLLRFPSVFL
jgi:hypothetical protein